MSTVTNEMLMQAIQELSETVNKHTIILTQMNQRLNNVEIRLDKTEQRLGNIEIRLDKMDTRSLKLQAQLEDVSAGQQLFLEEAFKNKKDIQRLKTLFLS